MPISLTSDHHIQSIAGQSVLLAMIVPSDDAPPAVREGLARRRVLVRTGSCPCGLRLPQDDAETWLAALRVSAHASTCPAHPIALRYAIAEWGAGR